MLKNLKKYTKDFIMGFKQGYKSGQNMKSYFKNLPTVQLNELLEEDQIRRIDKFFLLNYGTSLFDIVKGIRLTAHNVVDTAPQYGGLFLYKDNQISLANVGMFGFFQRITRDDREAFLVHELTHVLQWRDTSISGRLKALLTSFANIMLCFGCAKYYMKDALENEARTNQEKYMSLLNENKDIYEDLRKAQRFVNEEDLRLLYDITLEEAQDQVRELQERIF